MKPRALVGRITKISPEAASRAGWLFLYYFLVILALFVLARIVGRTIYVARLPARSLPAMYIGIAGVSVLSVLLYTRLTKKVARHQLASGTLVVFAALLIAFRALLELGHPAVSAVLYFSIESMCGIAAIQFWNIAADLFTTREAKRAFSFVGLGGVLASLCAFLVRDVSSRLGLENLLLVAGIPLVLAAVLVQIIGRATSGCRLKRQPEKRPLGHAARDMRKGGPLLALGCLTACTYLTVSLVDFQFNRVVKAELGEQDLANLMAKLLGTTGALSFVIQLFVTGPLIEHLGILAGLLVLPLGFCGTLLAFALHPTVENAALAKGCELLFRYTIHDASMQLLVVPLSALVRARIKWFVDGMVKPISVGLAGVLLWTLVGSNSAALVVTFFALGCWFVLASWNRREYVRSLVTSLWRHSVELDAQTMTAALAADRQQIQTMLQSDDPDRVLDALAWLQSADALRGWTDRLQDLCGHPDCRVREKALKLMAHPTVSLRIAETLARTGLSDAVASVRASAAKNLGARLGADAASTLLPMLDDEDATVCDVAATLLFDSPVQQARHAAVKWAAALANSENPNERKRALRIAGNSKRVGADALIARLLHDTDRSVQHEAIATAGQRGDPGLAGPLVDFLGELPLRRAAATALRAMGQAAEITLTHALADTKQKGSVRAQVALLLGALRTPSAMRALCAHLLDSSVAVRYAVAQAAVQARRPMRSLAFDSALVEKAFDETIAQWLLLAQCRSDLENLSSAQAVCLALTDRMTAQRRHALHLLELRHPECHLESATLLLEGRLARAHKELSEQEMAKVRANTFELIDNLVPERFRRKVVTLVEGELAGIKRTAPRDLLQGSRSQEVTKWLKELARSSDDFLAACALLSARASQHPDFADMAKNATAGPLSKEVGTGSPPPTARYHG